MIIPILAKKFPYLKIGLMQADINQTPEQFIKKSLITSLIVSITLTLASIMVFSRLEVSLLIPLLLFPVIYIAVFFFFMHSPTAKSNKVVREIDREIVYAGRFLLIELSAGIPLFDSIRNVSYAYPTIGRYFKKIVDKVETGMPIEQAINEVIEITPSDNFRKVLFQILNSMKTGGDVSKALESITEQISKEQLIKIKEYGKKLNPMVLFYLLIAVILPSLGVTILSLMSTFTGLTLSLSNLIGINFAIGVLQFSFLSIIGNLRKGV
ncbi:MAG: Type II secretion system protein [archaeon GW2011_AR20]|nr:MAG: Type II secretion system protein [archaeon GW2011_AR20]MBS3160731.1 type II secretion system F family protein [Candidatus Woesearchaeota archaeon]